MTSKSLKITMLKKISRNPKLAESCGKDPGLRFRTIGTQPRLSITKPVTLDTPQKLPGLQFPCLKTDATDKNQSSISAQRF